MSFSDVQHTASADKAGYCMNGHLLTKKKAIFYKEREAKRCNN